MALISRQNPLPLYIQLKEVIIEKVEKQVWKPGDTLPTEMELQKMYNVSRTTVRQALTELVTEGVLERIQGKGTYVAEPKLQPIRPELTGFTQDMSAKGHEVHSIVLEAENVECSEKLQRIFNLAPMSKVFKLVRLRLVDNTVIGYHEAFINYHLTPHIDFKDYDFAKESLYLTLAKEGITWGESDETVEASLAGDAQSKYLKIPSTAPVLKLSRVTRLQDGRPYEYTNMTYRADRYKYSIKLR
ncbi:GntR family transcriptional regulator [Pseudalkalibacillus sp. A8]|uniref:GntR family transcriptional regulator n=1 Tax=Pseudalkalibacillus sp. A8 TaxID=3382641 RepID=UPI0038B62FE0